MRFEDVNGDNDNDERDFETISKNETDVYIHVNQHNALEDFPQNPYCDRPNTNSSLYFDDGIRSVDYVLVWKKLIPRDLEDGAAKEKEENEIRRKESERAERRAVFEESLMSEGLELESYVIDDELHFKKIHAPLEVLRRYAEILKLRLPMKEVSVHKCHCIKLSQMKNMNHLRKQLHINI
jgi:anoctamin-1